LHAAEAVTAGPDWSLEHEAQWSALNARFHAILLELTGNRALLEAVRQTRRFPIVHGPESRPHDSVRLRQTYGDREHCARSLADHRLILESIHGRESTRAEHLMREHIYRNRDALRRIAERLFAQIGKAA
jgi:DNA-binding GntR family transcriptional regulator